MDELEISGRRYISTKRAGKDHKYHADYIGQLIRGNKVAGQKVGRAWYVDADSLAEYLGTEAAPKHPSASVGKIVEKPAVVEVARTPEPEVVTTIEEPIVEVAEEQNTSHIPVKITEKNTEQPIFYRTTKEAREAREGRTGLRYIADEGPLMPQVKKNVIHSTIIERAPAREESYEMASPITIKIAQPVYEREAPVYVQEERVLAPIAVAKRSKVRSNGALALARTAVVLMLGVVVFAVAAFASTHLIFVQTVDGGQSASAGFGIK